MGLTDRGETPNLRRRAGGVPLADSNRCERTAATSLWMTSLPQGIASRGAPADREIGKGSRNTAGEGGKNGEGEKMGLIEGPGGGWEQQRKKMARRRERAEE